METGALLDAAIALMFTYMILSMLASAAVEAVSSLFKSRAHWLRLGITNLLSGKATAHPAEGIAKEVLDHPLVKNLAMPQSSLIPTIFKRLRPDGPSYLPSDTFARSLIDVLKRRSNATSYDMAVENMNAGDLKSSLSALLVGNNSEDEISAKIEQWYDSAMDRVSGWYKRRRQLMLFVVGLALAFGLKIDSTSLYMAYANNDTCRAEVAQQARDFIAKRDNTKPAELLQSEANDLFNELRSKKDCGGVFGLGTEDSIALQNLLKIVESNDNVSRPCTICGSAAAAALMNPTCLVSCPANKKITARDGSDSANRWSAMVLLGYLITAFAISLGAPFWVDGLRKIISIRGAGIPPKPSANGGSGPVAPVTPISIISSAETGGAGFESTVSSDDIKDMQTVLGMKISEINGLFDERTRRKISEWQVKNGSAATGQIDKFNLQQIMKI